MINLMNKGRNDNSSNPIVKQLIKIFQDHHNLINYTGPGEEIIGEICKRNRREAEEIIEKLNSGSEVSKDQVSCRVTAIAEVAIEKDETSVPGILSKIQGLGIEIPNRYNRFLQNRPPIKARKSDNGNNSQPQEE